jgi:hypothetical protein
VVYAIQLYVGFRNTARRDAAITNVNTKLGATPQYGTPIAGPAQLRGTTDPALIVTARFINQADRDQMWADLDAALGTGVNGPVTGSRAWIHDCQHDENVGGCAAGATRAW